MGVIKTTKYNRDVLKEKDLRNFAFNSDHLNLQIVKIVKLTSGSSVWHGLGYCPLFMVLEARTAGGYGLIETHGTFSSNWGVDKNFVYTNSSTDAYIILFNYALS